MIDTPGICLPKISSDEQALKLSLVGCINDKIAGKEAIVDYLVYKLNKHRQMKYLQHVRGGGFIVWPRKCS
jgi:ribosome biogenesis GTPase A